MLRLPPFQYHRPSTVEEALELLDTHRGDAMPVAGGTDLIPNMKHRLFTPGHLVALKGIEALRGIRREADELAIGAGVTLASLAADRRVRRHVPSLAQAAGNVAGPQLRSAGTVGGNLCLDTRCTYYNQSAFWRRSLGYCLKKDGDRCHVTRVGKVCVAAHSADTPPVFMTLDARVDLAGPDGRRTLPVRDFFLPDGEWNTRRAPEELVTRIRIPLRDRARLRTGYAKLRQRRSIDFPLLTVAVAGEVDREERVVWIRGVVTGLGARPRELTGWDEIAEGEKLDEDVVAALAERAGAQCHPLENMIVDADWRKAMVPLYVRKAVEAMRDDGEG